MTLEIKKTRQMWGIKVLPTATQQLEGGQVLKYNDSRPGERTPLAGQVIISNADPKEPFVRVEEFKNILEPGEKATVYVARRIGRTKMVVTRPTD